MKEQRFPPTWCSSICDHSMMDVCAENCAIKRDCAWFKLKPGVTLYDLPRFPINETANMTRQEKFVSVAVYIDAMSRHLKGESHERDFLNSTRSVRNFKTLKKQSISFGPDGRNSPRQNRKECTNKGNGSS